MNKRGSGLGSARGALFNDIEAATDSGNAQRGQLYDDRELAEQENDRSLDKLSDRVSILKRVTMDINQEVDSQHRLLDRMGQDMDGTRGLLGGTMDRFNKFIKVAAANGLWLLDQGLQVPS
eukprot:jgi/Chlat1/2853/Chrsp194S03010